MPGKEFVHLHVHGEYSLQDATAKHRDLILAASENNMSAVALTDHGAMFGLVDFYKKATSKFKDKGIKPILGCETYVAPRKNIFKDSKVGDNANYHLVLLCENNKGYENLVQIISDAAVNGFYYKARTDKEQLKKWHEGLIALSACLGGEVSWKLLNESYESGKKAALEYDEIFGRGNFFLEIQDHGMPEQHQANEMILRLSKETGIPLVATNDVHYIKQEGAQPHDVLMAIQAGVTVHDEKRKRYPTDKFYFRSADEMWEIFGDIAPEALKNTVRIAERCNVTIEFGKYKIPKFEVPLPWNNNEEFLKHLTTEGVKRRYTPIISRLMDKMKINTEEKMWDIIYRRLDYEVSVISKMGYCDYFLIVWDFLRYYQRELDGPPSPGRGSGAGCIVAYTLNITHVEPLENGLLFERFLSPNRVSMPDLDIDFDIELRELAVEYVAQKYGRDKVCQIITFGTYAARAAIRAVGRALDVPYAIADKVAKMIPMENKITINKALDINKDLKAYHDSDAQVKQLIDYAIAIEGLPSNTSTHAAGVLICPEKVTNFVPVWVNDGVPVAQFNMIELEELGLLKMDFLGLRNLTVIRQTLSSIEKNHGIKITYNDLLKTIDDPDSFTMIQKGMTIGVFQLEGSGMTNFMTEFKPNSFDEIIAGISLFRPGPMDYIPRYLHNRANPQDIRYLHPKLERILKETNGVITYQEQCMFAAVDLAGYSQADADDFRRAISKKKQEEIDKHKNWFIYGREEDSNVLTPGCIRNNIDEEIAKQIFEEMEEFSKYAFNKSHAAAYAVLACETSWLKYKYPVEFMAALLTSVSDNLSQVAKYIIHCKRDLKIPVLPPDINESKAVFVATKHGEIRFGLAAAKSVGVDVVDAIVEERERFGNYKTLNDFLIRTAGKVNRGQVENLIKIGAFDYTDKTRSQLIAILYDSVEGVKKYKNKYKDGQMILFKESLSIDDVVPPLIEYPDRILFGIEKEIAGFYMSGHPLNLVRTYAEQNSTVRCIDLVPVDENGEGIIEELPYYDGQNVSLVCIITGVHKILTKRNDPMAFVMVEDLYGESEIIVFPNLYEIVKDILCEDIIIHVNGKISTKDNAVKIIADNIKVVEEKRERAIYVFTENIPKLKVVLDSTVNNSGNILVYIINNQWRMLLPKEYWTNEQGLRTLKSNNIKYILKGGN